MSRPASGFHDHGAESPGSEPDAGGLIARVKGWPIGRSAWAGHRPFNSTEVRDGFQNDSVASRFTSGWRSVPGWPSVAHASTPSFAIRFASSVCCSATPGQYVRASKCVGPSGFCAVNVSLGRRDLNYTK